MTTLRSPMMFTRTLVSLALVSTLMVFTALLSGCADEGASCADKSVELAALCAPGCDWELMQEDSAECGLNGIFNPFGGGSAGGRCESSGSCGFICSVNTELCEHGVSSITRDAYTCAQEGACDVEGAIQCNNGMVSVCAGGSWAAPMACPESDEVCDLADDMTLGCVPGEVFELPKASSNTDSVSGGSEGEGETAPGVPGVRMSDEDMCADNSECGEACYTDCGEDPCMAFNLESCVCEMEPDCE
jgi:hypothetical protein